MQNKKGYPHQRKNYLKREGLTPRISRVGFGEIFTTVDLLNNAEKKYEVEKTRVTKTEIFFVFALIGFYLAI